MTDQPIFPSLLTATPDEGYDLAVKLSRFAVRLTQSDPLVREKLRQSYAQNPVALIAAAQVVATHFSTVAAANNYWKEIGL